MSKCLTATSWAANQKIFLCTHKFIGTVDLHTFCHFHKQFERNMYCTIHMRFGCEKKLKQSTKFVFLFETHKSLVSICRLTRFASHVRSRENICHLFIEHFLGKNSENMPIKLKDLLQVAILVFYILIFGICCFLIFRFWKINIYVHTQSFWKTVSSSLVQLFIKQTQSWYDKSLIFKVILLKMRKSQSFWFWNYYLAD